MTSIMDFQTAVSTFSFPNLSMCLTSNLLAFEAITIDVQFPRLLETYIQDPGVKLEYNSIRQLRERLLRIDNNDKMYKVRTIAKYNDFRTLQMSHSKSVQTLHQEQSTSGIIRKSPSSRSVRSQIDTRQILFDRSKQPILPQNPQKQDDIYKMTELIRQTSSSQLPSSIIRPEQSNSLMIGSNPSFQIPEQPPTQKIPQPQVLKQNILHNHARESFKLIKRSSKNGSKIKPQQRYSPLGKQLQISNHSQEQIIISKDKKPKNYKPFSNSISKQISSRLEQAKSVTDQTVGMRRVTSQTKLFQTPPRNTSPQRSQINSNIKFDYPDCRLSQYQSIYNRNSSPKQESFKSSQNFVICEMKTEPTMVPQIDFSKNYYYEN